MERKGRSDVSELLSELCELQVGRKGRADVNELCELGMGRKDRADVSELGVSWD